MSNFYLSMSIKILSFMVLLKYNIDPLISMRLINFCDKGNPTKKRRNFLLNK